MRVQLLFVADIETFGAAEQDLVASEFSAAYGVDRSFVVIKSVRAGSVEVDMRILYDLSSSFDRTAAVAVGEQLATDLEAGKNPFSFEVLQEKFTSSDVTIEWAAEQHKQVE